MLEKIVSHVIVPYSPVSILLLNLIPSTFSKILPVVRLSFHIVIRITVFFLFFFFLSLSL